MGIQLNRTTDYALRILVYLGQNNRFVPSSEMANNMKISQRYLLSIAKKLKEHGYIKAGLGSDGGYVLAKALYQITMYDVVVLMEGSIIISRCLTFANHCEGHPCVLHAAYSFLQSILENYLHNLTVDMLVNHPKDNWQGMLMDGLNEMQKGYKHKDKVIRPSMVKVAN